MIDGKKCLPVTSLATTSMLKKYTPETKAVITALSTKNMGLDNELYQIKSMLSEYAENHATMNVQKSPTTMPINFLM